MQKRLFKSLFRRNKKEKILFTPGPVLLSPSIRKSLAFPLWHHRSLEFEKVLKETLSQLKKIFLTEEPVLILNSSGSGAMEAAITNCLSPKDEILCVSSGKFGERWKEIAKNYKLNVHSLDLPYGQAVSTKQIKEQLEKNKKIKACLLTACETSTATEHPIKEVSKLLKQYPKVLSLVDGITGLGAMELPMTKWEIDVLIGASQKSFMIPTGLSFISLSKKAWKAYETSSCPKYYFDLKKEKLAQTKGQTAFSSNVTFIRALKESLSIIEKKGLKTCISRSKALKESTHCFCKILNLKLFSSRPANSVTAIQLPESLSAKKLADKMEREYGFTIACGQGELKDKILRIGHLGPIKDRQQLKMLKVLGLEIQKKNPSLFKKKQIKMALFQAKKRLLKA